MIVVAIVEVVVELLVVLVVEVLIVEDDVEWLAVAVEVVDELTLTVTVGLVVLLVVEDVDDAVVADDDVVLLTVEETDEVELPVVALVVAELVLVLNIDVEETFEGLSIIELNDGVCVSARAKNPGNDDRRARKAMVMRMHELISLPKSTTSTPS